jgi:hypothetical protein
MFQRLIFQDWQLACAVAALAAAVVFFVGMIWGALRLTRSQAERLARLPLEEDRRPPAPPAAS